MMRKQILFVALGLSVFCSYAQTERNDSVTPAFLKTSASRADKHSSLFPFRYSSHHITIVDGSLSFLDTGFQLAKAI